MSGGFWAMIVAIGAAAATAAATVPMRPIDEARLEPALIAARASALRALRSGEPGWGDGAPRAELARRDATNASVIIVVTAKRRRYRRARRLKQRQAVQRAAPLLLYRAPPLPPTSTGAWLSLKGVDFSKPPRVGPRSETASAPVQYRLSATMTKL
jgi:hypothetical protein